MVVLGSYVESRADGEGKLLCQLIVSHHHLPCSASEQQR